MQPIPLQQGNICCCERYPEDVDVTTLETVPLVPDLIEGSAEDLIGSQSEPVAEKIDDLEQPEEQYADFHKLRPFPHPLKHPFLAAYWVWELSFGLFSLLHCWHSSRQCRSSIF